VYFNVNVKLLTKLINSAFVVSELRDLKMHDATIKIILSIYFFLFICVRAKLFILRAMCGIEYKTPCAPVAVCRIISNGDQQLCMKLDDQC